MSPHQSDHYVVQVHDHFFYKTNIFLVHFKQKSFSLIFNIICFLIQDSKSKSYIKINKTKPDLNRLFRIKGKTTRLKTPKDSYRLKNNKSIMKKD